MLQNIPSEVLKFVAPMKVALPEYSDLYASQRTIGRVVTCRGVGLHSGKEIGMVMRPGSVNTGVIFNRTDISGKAAVVPAHYMNVVDTRMNTTIGNDCGVVVGTIEHLMAALSAFGIDNIVIDIDGPEIPVMDGSAAPFISRLEKAGLSGQIVPRRVIEIMKMVKVQDGDKSAALIPASEFSVEVEIGFDAGAIGDQHFSHFVTLNNFKSEIARARTFGFEYEVDALRAAGLALGGSLENAVVISRDGSRVLNEDGLRFEDEFVRHKVLDAIGDLFLAGSPILAHFHGVKTGHALNNKLLRAVFADRTAWRMVSLAGDLGDEEEISCVHRVAFA